MKINTEITNGVNAADAASQYDERAKRLIGSKIILAHILASTVDEFRGMKPEDIVPYIEKEPVTGAVPTEPGLTNASADAASDESGPVNASANRGIAFNKCPTRITGFNTESLEINEGLVRFDIVFYVRMKDGISQIIINIELQKDSPSGYDIPNRALFYVSRLISSQKERDFTGMDYNAIKRVFSIWICMNMRENSMEHIHLTKDRLLGTYEWKVRSDLLNIVLIGLSDEIPMHDEEYELHRLLGTLLSTQISADEKLRIIKTEYGILLEENIEEEVSGMCNLSQGIWEMGMREGMREGIEKAELSAIENIMLKLKITAEQAMDMLDIAADRRTEYISLLGR